MVTSFNIGLSKLSRLPGNSSENSIRVARKKMSAEGRRVLSLLVNRPLAETDIETRENGRPYFTSAFSECAGADFNISHSGDIAAVSYVCGTGVSAGCDIQEVRSRTSVLKIAEKFFKPQEIDFVSLDELNFFKLWVLKECFLKLRGMSVFDMAKVPSFINDNGCFAFSCESEFSFFLYELGQASARQYMLAAAAEGEGAANAAPVIKWFSQDFLPRRSIVEIKAAASPAETVSPNI